MSSPLYGITYKPSAAKELRKLEKTDQQRVARLISSLAQNPRPRESEKVAGGAGELRVKVGPWRVIYDVEDGRLVILVLRVAHRREVYDQRRMRR